MSSVPLRQSNRGKKASDLPKESGIRGASGKAKNPGVKEQRVLKSGHGNNLSEAPDKVPTPSDSLSSPKKNVKYIHWKREKLVRTGVNYLSKDIAASASNPIYQQNYGSLESDDNEDDYDDDDSYCCPPSEDEGGEDEDDDDFVDIDPASDDEGRSSFPKNKTPRNYLIGAPQKTDTTGMTGLYG
jgi:hypothetical protein